MKISFCLTTYNKKEILEITLENYFANKKSNYELIISDGCSTDGTVEYLQNLKNEGKIDTLILSEKQDGGEWDGFKKTLDYVTGEYFYFLTDDDYFDFKSIDTIVEFIKTKPEIDYLIASGYDFGFYETIRLDYHSCLKRAGTTNIKYNGLYNGLCGLGLFIKNDLRNKLELFSKKYGKRVDKTITLELLNSDFNGASTNISTYVGIKNEKSNSHIYNYDWETIEKIESLNDNINKNFKINSDNYKQRFEIAKHIINNSMNNEFAIYKKIQ
jgi:glycosyltransferase involved in cell wall biosynthesis